MTKDIIGQKIQLSTKKVTKIIFCIISIKINIFLYLELLPSLYYIPSDKNNKKSKGEHKWLQKNQFHMSVVVLNLI